MMWPTRSIDLSWDDWLFALEVALNPGDAESAARHLEAVLPGDHEFIPCLTLRSAFDLYLRASDWSSGDEIAFTAVTVASMPAVARLHGLVPIGVDIDPVSTAPSPAALERVLTPRTRAVVVAHLFGASVDVEPLLELTRARGIALIEDRAQAYTGDLAAGHADADVVLHSFGPLKNATALGGGLARVRDAAITQCMREVQAADPEQPANDFLTRVLAWGAMKAASHPVPFGVLGVAADLTGRDLESVVHGMTRNVSGEALSTAIRQRPGPALLRLLERRLAAGDRAAAERARKGRLLHAELGADVVCPTRGADPHGFWMTPVLVRDRNRLSTTLRRAGFFSMRPRLDVVGEASPGATHLVEEGVCIPFDAAMPDEVLVRLAREVRDSPPGEAPALLAPPGEPAP